MKGKWIFFFTILISSTTWANTNTSNIFFFEWKKDLQLADHGNAIKLLTDYGISINSDSWKMELTDAQAKELQLLNVFSFLEKNKIESIIKTVRHSSVNTLDNSIWSKEWHLDKIKINNAWKTTKGSSKIIVAVCDSGVQADHRELAGKVLKGWNFIDDNEDTSPNTNHGTAVSGFIAASEVNNFGAYGVAPGITILPGKIVTTSGGVPTSAMLGCIRWAADQGAKVINVSMTGVDSNSSASAARYANKKGAVVIWAAGNQNYFTRWKDKPEIIAVAGTDIDNNRYYSKVTSSDGKIKYYGSNRGDFVDIAAPGEDLFTIRVNESFSRGNGTSYSAPMVSGVAALIFSVNPKLKPNKVTEILKASATKMKNSKHFGSGIVNATRAVALAKKTL